MAKKKSKSKTLADRIENAANIIRTLPDTLNAQAQFEDADKPEKLPYNPTEWWLLNAGAHVRGAMRLGCLKDYENQLLSADGENSIWKELIRILRKRAGLPCPRDYLRDFADDCQLVADGLLQDYYSQDITCGTWQANAIKLLFEHRDWSIEKIAKMVGKSKQAFYKDGKGKGLGGKNEGVSGAIEGRSGQKKAGKRPPSGGKNSDTGQLEAWEKE